MTLLRATAKRKGKFNNKMSISINNSRSRSLFLIRYNLSRSLSATLVSQGPPQLKSYKDVISYNTATRALLCPVAVMLHSMFSEGKLGGDLLTHRYIFQNNL